MAEVIFNEKLDNLVVWGSFEVFFVAWARPQVRGKGLKEQGKKGLRVTSELGNWSMGNRPPFFSLAMLVRRVSAPDLRNRYDILDRGNATKTRGCARSCGISLPPRYARRPLRGYGGMLTGVCGGKVYWRDHQVRSGNKFLLRPKDSERQMRNYSLILSFLYSFIPLSPYSLIPYLSPMPPWHDTLLSTLTLGTARRDISTELTAWLEEKDALDPTVTPDAAEQLLTAWTITERLQRLQPGQQISLQASAAPPEERELPGPRQARALELILRGTYPALLPEAVAMLEARQQVLPPHLLPELLDEATKQLTDQPNDALRLLHVGGRRALWLARQHPDWSALDPDNDMSAAWAAEATPGRRAPLLRRWRAVAPLAAREGLASIWPGQSPKNQETLLSGLMVGLSQEDVDWLRAGLGPKRRGVRRAILRLLLLAGEQQAHEELLRVATVAFDEYGKFLNILTDDDAKTIIDTYGGLSKQESISEFLLGNLPPAILPELIDQSLPEFWASLTKSQLRAAVSAINDYADHPTKVDFISFALIANPEQLPVNLVAEIAADLPQEDFLTIYHQLLTSEQAALHHNGLARLLALSREEPWSDRISKAFILQLVGTLRNLTQLPFALQRDLQSHWKLSIPLLSPGIFGWSRTHLHSMTERADVFGKLATETLQTLAFRRVLWEE